MSKREEMKKLRQMRMKQLENADRSTPAEEAAARAEEALEEETVKADNKITPEKKNDTEPKEASKESDTRPVPESTESRPGDKMASSESEILAKTTEIQPERPDKNAKTETIEVSKKENPESVPVNTKEKEDKTTENNFKYDYTYQAKAQKCGLTHTTIMLTSECMNFLRTRSLQMGMAQQDYFNMLIEEDRAIVDNSEGMLTPDEQVLGRINLHGKKSKNITVTIDNFHFMKKAAALRGISQTNYANYILLKELFREEKYGRRPGKYD